MRCLPIECQIVLTKSPSKYARDEKLTMHTLHNVKYRMWTVDFWELTDDNVQVRSMWGWEEYVNVIMTKQSARKLYKHLVDSKEYAKA